MIQSSEDHAIRIERPGVFDIADILPTGRSVGIDVLGFARPQDRHRNRDTNGEEPT